jgi:outer membrane lipoprotein-sorting protein
MRPQNRWLWTLPLPLLLLAFSGCAAGGRLTPRPDIVSRRGTTPHATASPKVSELAAQMNRNAQLVNALTASTTVSASGSRFGTGVSGQMALERPRNFKMELEKGLSGSTVVDVGSNDDEFWFWMKDSEKKAIYVGQYDAQGDATGEFLFHPDWIIEALGLRNMPAAEIEQAKLQPGRDPNTLVLTQRRGDGKGGTRVKQTVLDARTLAVKEHIFYGPDNKSKVAEVFPSSYRRYTIDQAGTSTVELPQRIQLRLTPPDRTAEDAVTMDIALRDIKINPQFTDVNRQALFSIPTYPGYEVVELVPRSPGRASHDRDDSRRASHDVLLEAPRPMRSEEGAWLHGRDPAPLGQDLPGSAVEPLGTERLVRPFQPDPPVMR